jgi:hypothetical protein
MIRRLLAAGAMSAIVLAGAIVALEAFGLLFQRGAPEPAILNIHAQEVPEESAPALLWKRLEEEQQRRHEAERQEAARRAAEEERKLAEQKVAALGPAPLVDPPWRIEVQPVPEQARVLKVTVSVAEPELGTPTVHRASARPDRARSIRRGAGRVSGPGCPFLGWLEAVMAPPAPRRGAI